MQANRVRKSHDGSKGAFNLANKPMEQEQLHLI
jgi:hypothetical protein